MCKLLDSSDTSQPPQCATYESVTSAFGGAPSLSIADLLSYASAESRAGGTIWYANNKTTQELAKDTFEAVDNAIAQVVQ